MKIGMSAREHTLKVMAGRSITDQCCFCEQVKSLLSHSLLCFKVGTLLLYKLIKYVDAPIVTKFCMYRSP
jgi:hypothetical protein